MALSDLEKASIRDFLGYLNITSAASIQLGFPSASQALFMVETAMNRVIDIAEQIVRRHLEQLGSIDEQLMTARDRMKAQSTSGITLRADEADQLRKEQQYWAGRLADSLGVPLNPYAARWSGGGFCSANIQVHHGI